MRIRRHREGRYIDRDLSSELRDRLRVVCAQLMHPATRRRLSFMDGARAACLLAATKDRGSGSKAAACAEHLGISRQNLHDWVKRDINKWLARMESLLAGRAVQRARRRKIISEDDVTWLCALREKARNESTRAFRERVRGSCEREGRIHLRGLSHTALANAAKAGRIAQNDSASA